MATPEEFEREMIQFGLTAKRNAVRAVRKAFMTVTESLATETPADTGTAISNWIATIGAPAEGTREAFVRGSGGSTRDANAAETIGEAQTVAEEYVGDGESLHLANNLKYIEVLNAGSSKQAPALFFEAAVARGAESVKGVRLLD